MTLPATIPDSARAGGIIVGSLVLEALLVGAILYAIYQRMLRRQQPAPMDPTAAEQMTADQAAERAGMFMRGPGHTRFAVREGDYLVGASSFTDQIAVWQVQQLFFLDGQWRCLLRMLERQRDKYSLPGHEGYVLPVVRREITQMNQAHFRPLDWERDTGLLAQLLVPPSRPQ